MQRRDLLLSGLSLSAIGVLEKCLQAVPASAEEPAEFDQDSYRFWTSEIDEPSRLFAEHGKIVSQRGEGLPGEAEFLYYSADTGFVRAATTEGDTPLSRTLPSKGDSSFLLSIDTIRPSSGHMERIVQQKNGSLKIDLKQAFPLQQLSETLNWSAIASLVPGDKAFSQYHTINFDPKSTWGQAKKVPLISGVGFWAWNFSTQQKPSKWSQVMGMLAGNKKTDASSADGSKTGAASSSGLLKMAGDAVQGFGLPAVAKTAFGAINQVFGALFAQGSPKNEWILHSADTVLLATQDSRQKHPGRAVMLRSGSYLVTTSDSTHDLLSGKYQLRNGVVVPSGTSDADLDEAAKAALPKVSYIALSTIVEPID